MDINEILCLHASHKIQLHSLCNPIMVFQRLEKAYTISLTEMTMGKEKDVFHTGKKEEENEAFQQEEGYVVMECVLEMDNISPLEHSNEANDSEWGEGLYKRMYAINARI